MGKKAKLSGETSIDSIVFRENEKSIIINKNIRLEFNDPYHFNIVFFIAKATKNYPEGKVPKEIVEGIIFGKAGINKKGETYSSFETFNNNMWLKGISKGHTNNQYFKVKINGKIIGQKDEKDLTEIDEKRRAFLKKIFKNEGSQFFYLGVDKENIITNESELSDESINLNANKHNAIIGIGRDDGIFKEDTIESFLKKLENGSELFIVARSASCWSPICQSLTKAITKNNLKVIIVIADSKAQNPVVNDTVSEVTIANSYNNFKKALMPELEKYKDETDGSFKLYKIPSFVTASFTAFQKEYSPKQCVVEFGINNEIGERVNIAFTDNGEDNCAYRSLYEVHRCMLDERDPDLSWNCNDK